MSVGHRLLEIIDDHVGSRGHDVALSWYRNGHDGHVSLTWHELSELVERLTDRLEGLVPRRTLVPVLGYSTPTLVATFMALLRLGAVPTLFPPPSPRQDPDQFLHQQQSALGALDASMIIAIGLEVPAGWEGYALEMAEDGSVSTRGAVKFDAAILADDVLFVQHSSGTTAVKKGVPFTETQLLGQLSAYCTMFERPSGEFRPVIATWLPLYHDMGFVANLMLTLYTGGEMAFVDAYDWTADPTIFMRIIAERRAEVVWLPNFAFKHLARFAGRVDDDLSSVTEWINCSEPCKWTTMGEFCEAYADQGVRFEALRCSYGMAETVFAVTQTAPGATVRQLFVEGTGLHVGESAESVLCEPGPATTSVVSQGPVLPGVELRTLHDGGLGSPEVIGELCVSAPYMFDNYLGAGDRGPEDFVDGFYRTGDIGFVHRAEVFVLGRIKDVIIVNGRNHLAHEIEAVVGAVAGVRPGRVVALGIYSDRVGSEELHVVAELRDAADGLETTIRSVIHDAFGLVPRAVQLVAQPWIIKSSSGKMSRGANRERYEEDFLT